MNRLETTANRPQRNDDSAFAGPIGEEYDLLRLACPASADMSRLVGEFVKQWKASSALCGTPHQVVEIGCGTGITTLALLSAGEDQMITAVDIAPAMLAQAERHLAPWLQSGHVRLIERDALEFLAGLPDDATDIVASGYAFHNFTQDYRRQVIGEVYRVLKPGGVFVNGDRYALDDTVEHLGLIQQEVRHFFDTFGKLGRYDLLEQWIVHLFSDESPDHVMPLTPALQSYREAGFTNIRVRSRHQNNAMVSAEKPKP